MPVAFGSIDLLGQEVALHENDRDLGDHGHGEADAEHRAPVGAHGGHRAVQDFADSQGAERDHAGLRGHRCVAPSGPLWHATPARSGRRCARAVAGGARRGPLPRRRLCRRPLSGCAASVNGRGGPGNARLLAVGGGGSGRSPARRVVHRCSFTVLSAHRGGRLPAIVPRAGPVRTGRCISFLPSCASRSAGRLGRWLIRTRERRCIPALRLSP